jgi:hypothetical protein
MEQPSNSSTRRFNLFIAQAADSTSVIRNRQAAHIPCITTARTGGRHRGWSKRLGCSVHGDRFMLGNSFA